MRNILFTLFAVLLISAIGVGSANAQSALGYNADVTLLPSGSSTPAVASGAWITDTVLVADQKNNDYRGLNLLFDITDTAGTASVTLTIQGKDAVSGKYYTILAGAAKTAPGSTLMTVYPGCIAAANTVANLPLPKVWRAWLNVPSGDSVKATVGASLIK